MALLRLKRALLGAGLAGGLLDCLGLPGRAFRLPLEVLPVKPVPRRDDDRDRALGLCLARKADERVRFVRLDVAEERHELALARRDGREFFRAAEDADPARP